MATCAVMAASSMVGMSASALTPYDNPTTTSTMTATSTPVTLTVSTYNQLDEHWCWAACVRMLLKYYNGGTPETQAEIVEHVKGEVIDEGASDDEVKNALRDLLDGTYTITKISSTSMSFDRIQDCIDNGNPVYLRVVKNNTSHAVICSGYKTLSDGSKQIFIQDPGQDTANYWGTIDSNNTITNGTVTKGTIATGLYCRD